MSHPEFLTASWPAPPNVVAGTTQRLGGFSQAPFADFNVAAHVGDDPQTVNRNRERLRDQLELPSEPNWLQQVHGTGIVTAPSRDASPEADACIAASPNTVCAVMTADCLPVLFTSIDGQTVAAAHAGWRGLCAGILEATVAAIPCNPDQLLAWLGPAISQAAFEVGDEVREQFIDQDAAAAKAFEAKSNGRWRADLYSLARLRLSNSGVTAIFGGDRCTYTESETFFSYRREGQTGRMASLIYRRA